MDGIETRLAALENTVKRLKWTAALSALGLIVTLTTSALVQDQAPIHDVLRTRKLQVVNENGVVLLESRSDSYLKGGQLMVMGLDGQVGGNFAVGAEGQGGLVLNGNARKRAVELTADKQGNGEFTLWNTESNGAVRATVSPEGYGQFALSSRNGKIAATLLATDRGGALIVDGADEKHRALVAADDRGEGTIGVFVRSGESRVYSPLTK